MRLQIQQHHARVKLSPGLLNQNFVDPDSVSCSRAECGAHMQTHVTVFAYPDSVSCSRAAPGESEAIAWSAGHIVSCYPFYSPCIILKSNIFEKFLKVISLKNS